MTDPTELDELDSLLTSGAWQRLVAHYEQEWGPAGETFVKALQAAVSGGVGTEAEAVHRLKNVTYAQQAVARFLAWPRERVAQLKARKDVMPMGSSRRGPGL